ncbi:MAG: flagellar assembly peptidoglycan hydrolase FlgJ [Methylococcaceae bacterium]|nr:flagellar assembly peptidoglycan hydrolase FlgJ [Methylococcaceae bacterium]
MLSNVNSADVYTDFNGLAKLKTEAKQQTPEAIKEVAKQFESIFLGMVLKSMRAAKLTDGSILDNEQSKFFQDMHDQQLSVQLSGDPGIGLAAVIEQQLSPKKSISLDKLGIDDYRVRPVDINRPSKAMRKLTSIEAVSVDTVSFESIKIEDISSENEHIKTAKINSKEDFVRILSASAQKAAQELGVEAKTLLAQAALESGWGRGVIKMADGSSSFNLFNIKTHKDWSGKQVAKNTLEFDGGIARQEKARFRAYESYQDSFNDYVRFIKENPRYQQALQQTEKAERYMHELQAAGYATDPAYAKKVMRIYHDDVFSDLPRPNVVVADAKE